MDSVRDVLQNYLYFAIIFAIFIVALFISITIINKKGKKRSLYLYGLLMDYNNKQILALSLILINFLLMIYTLIMKINLTLSYGIICMLVIILAFGSIEKYKYIFINGFINLVNIGLIYLANLVNTLRISNPSTLYYILQIAINIFGLLFYIFTTFKFIKNIREKGEISHEKTLE